MENETTTIMMFDVSDTDGIAQKWLKWCNRLKRLFNIKNVQDGKKIDYLLFYGGEAIEDIYEQIKHNDDTFDDVVKKILDHFSPKSNKQMNIFKFRAARQEDDESFVEFLIRLRQLAKCCEFEGEDEEIKNQMIQACKSERVMRKALEKVDITLEQLINIGKLDESVEKQIKELKSSKDSPKEPETPIVNPKRTRARNTNR